jgi:hypothetical protein
VNCDYCGNNGTNLSVGYCQNEATHDYGRRARVVGVVREVRRACDEHVARLGFYTFCRRAGHAHEWMAVR